MDYPSGIQRYRTSMSRQSGLANSTGGWQNKSNFDDYDPRGYVGASQNREFKPPSLFDSFGPSSMRDRFGSSNMRDRFGPSDMRDRFGPSDMRDGFGPPSFRDIFGSNMNDRFGPNMSDRFGPNMSDRFGPSNMSDRFGPSNMSDIFGPSNMSDRFGPSNMSDRFGPSNMSDRFGPSNMSDRIGRPNVRDRLGMNSNYDSFEGDNFKRWFSSQRSNGSDGFFNPYANMNPRDRLGMRNNDFMYEDKYGDNFPDDGWGVPSIPNPNILCPPTKKNKKKSKKKKEDDEEDNDNQQEENKEEQEVDLTDIPDEIKIQMGNNMCKLCAVKLNSQPQAKTHYEGKSHAKKLKEAVQTYNNEGHVSTKIESAPKRKKIAMDEVSQLYCKCCDLSFTSPDHATQHYLGRNHYRVLNGLKPLKAGYYNRKTGKWQRMPPDPTVIVQMIATDESSHNAVKKGQFYCDLCGVNATSPEQMHQHMIGIKHKKKLEKQDQDEDEQEDPYSSGGGEEDSADDGRGSPRCYSGSFFD